MIEYYNSYYRNAEGYCPNVPAFPNGQIRLSLFRQVQPQRDSTLKSREVTYHMHMLHQSFKKLRSNRDTYAQELVENLLKLYCPNQMWSGNVAEVLPLPQPFLVRFNFSFRSYSFFLQKNIYRRICLVVRLSNRTLLPKIGLTRQFCFFGICPTGLLEKLGRLKIRL